MSYPNGFIKSQQPGGAFTVATLPTATQMIGESIGALAYTTDGGLYAWNGSSWSNSNLASGFISGLIVNSTTAASSNSLIINNALALQGLAIIPAGLGIIYFSGTLTIPSDTTFIVGKGTILTRTSLGGTAFVGLINQNYNSTVFNVSGTLSVVGQPNATSTAILVTATISGGTITAPGYVIVKNDSTNYYNGVYKLVSTTATTVTWQMACTQGGSPPTSGSSITIAQADANISIDVQGYFEGGYANNVVGINLNSMGIIMNKVGNLQVPTYNGGGWTKYCFLLANTYFANFGTITVNNNSDGIHLNSPNVGFNLSTLRGRTSDDSFAITANNAGFTQYALPDDTGDTDGVNIGVIDMDYAATAACAIYAYKGQSIRNITIGKVINRNPSAPALVMSSPTLDATNIGTIEDVTVGYIDGQGQLINSYCSYVNKFKFYVPPTVAGVPNSYYTTTGNTTSGSTTVTSVASTTGLYRGAYVIGPNIAAGTKIRTISGSTITLSVPAIASGTGTTLNFEVPSNRTNSVMFVGANSYFGSIEMSGEIFANTTTSGAAWMIYFNQVSACGAYSIDVQNFKISEVGDANKAYHVIHHGGPNCYISNIYANNVLMEGNGAFAYNNDGASVKYILSNMLLRDAQMLLGDISTESIHATNISIEGTISLPAFYLNGTSHTYNLALTNIRDNNTSSQATFNYGTTNTINLKASDGSYQIDGTKVTTFTPGVIFYNNNASYSSGVGLYAMGAASTTRIAA